MSTARHEIPPEMLCEVGLEPQGVYDVYDVYNVSRELPLAPEFPIDAMPAGCRLLIREASDTIGCPPEFVALPMLAVLVHIQATSWGMDRCSS